MTCLLRSFFPFKVSPPCPAGWRAWPLPAHPSCCQLLSWFLIPLIHLAPDPSGGGRAGLSQGCCCSALRYIPNERRGGAVPVLGATECGNPTSSTAWLYKAEQLLCSRAPPSQGRYWFTLVLGLVQTPGEHPSSASAGRNRGPFQLAGKCPLKLAFLGKSRFSQAKPLVGLCVESWGGFCCSHAAPEERGLPGLGPRAG